MDAETIGPQLQKVWLARISKEQKAHKEYRDRAKEVNEIFRQDADFDVYVPLLWSVVQVQHSGIYSNQPRPDARPRNDTWNPAFRQTATLINRGLAYCIDHPSFDSAMHRAVDDYLGVGLGVVRIKLDSVINKTYSSVPVYQEVMTPMGPEQVQVGQREEVNETVGDQTVRWEYVPFTQFGWEPANDWKHVDWIYFRHKMTQAQIKRRFGKPVAAGKEENEKRDLNKIQTYDIFEVWDKKKREVLFIAKGEAEPLEVLEDPLGLVDFFPCPRPMMTNICAEELVPQPDYDYIEHFDRELNRLHERRMSLVEQIKATGAYDKSLVEFGEILELEDGEMKPIDNLMQRLNAAGGPENAFWFNPVQDKVQALQIVTEQTQMIKAQVDEILGISDIVRGVTAASETATAQEIKGRWVGVRLTRKRETVIYTIKSMLTMMSQLFGSHILPENMQRMTQIQVTEEMMQILSDDVLMSFVIDIETDSTIAKDEFREMQTKQDMLNGVAQYAQSVLPMVQQNAMPAGVASAILKSALKPYMQYDRQLEEEMANLQGTMQQLQGLQQQLQQSQQESQNTQMQLQQAQQLIQMLQQQAAEAKAQKEQADAMLKTAQSEKVKAETRELYGETKEGALRPVKTAAEIAELRERAASYEDRGQVSKNQPIGGQ